MDVAGRGQIGESYRQWQLQSGNQMILCLTIACLATHALTSKTDIGPSPQLGQAPSQVRHKPVGLRVSVNVR
jgi:hypothetical protein